MTDSFTGNHTISLHLYLSRHGETEWNTQTRMQGRGDSPLTEKGLEGARRLADSLADINLTAAFCSPAPRARITAQIALSGKSVPLIEDDRIHEMALGRFEGLTVQEAYRLDHERMDAFFHHPDSFVPWDGETFDAVYQRIQEFLTELTTDPIKLIRHRGFPEARLPREADDCRILIISHNITIKTMLTILQGRPVSRLREGGPIPQTTLIPALLAADGSGWQLPGN